MFADLVSEGFCLDDCQLLKRDLPLTAGKRENSGHDADYLPALHQVRDSVVHCPPGSETEKISCGDDRVLVERFNEGSDIGLGRHGVVLVGRCMRVTTNEVRLWFNPEIWRNRRNSL